MTAQGEESAAPAVVESLAMHVGALQHQEWLALGCVEGRQSCAGHFLVLQMQKSAASASMLATTCCSFLMV